MWEQSDESDVTENLNNDGFHDLWHFLPIIGAIKPKMMEWMGHVVRVMEWDISAKFLPGNPS